MPSTRWGRGAGGEVVEVGEGRRGEGQVRLVEHQLVAPGVRRAEKIAVVGFGDEDDGGSPAVLGQPALGLDRGLAAHARGGHGLAVDVVGAVAGDVDARHPGLHLRAGGGLEIAVLIDVERLGERLRCSARGRWRRKCL